MDEADFADRVLDDFVGPLYSSVNMQAPPDPERARLIAGLARQASVDEVLWMLGAHWRARRVGAWFALIHSEQEVGKALLDGLRRADGHLAAVDVGFAAARHLGADALPALHEYQTIAAQRQYGGLSTLTALIESLGGASQLAPSTDFDRETLSNRREWADLLLEG